MEDIIVEEPTLENENDTDSSDELAIAIAQTVVTLTGFAVGLAIGVAARKTFVKLREIHAAKKEAKKSEEEVQD